MFIQRKPTSDQVVDLNERFKDEASIETRKAIAAQGMKQSGVLNSIRTPSVGEPLTSNFHNNFIEDMKFNVHNLLSQTNNLVDSFALTEHYSDKSFRYLLSLADTLGSDIKEAETKQALNYKSILHFNSFKRIGDLQFTNIDKSFLIQYPLTTTSLNKKYMLSTASGEGLTLPIKSILNLSIVSITRDHSDSQWGQLLIDENDPNVLLDNGIYKLVLLDRYQDSLGNVYTRSETYHVSLWFEFGGVQVINRLAIKTNSNMKVVAVSYLDQNENEVQMDFDEFYSSGSIVINFNAVTARTLKVKLALVTSNETTMFEEEFGRVYSFTISSVNAFYDKFENTGYFLSYPRMASGLTGAKYNVSQDLVDGSFLSDTYLKIEHYNSAGNLLRTISVPILADYDAEQTFSLYFVNNQAKLFFYPESTFELYKNGILLVAGTDYNFFTSVDSALTSTLPVIDDSGTNVLYINLTSFDAAAKYTCIYKPHPSAKILGKFSYSNDTHSLSALGAGKYKVYLFTVIRQQNSNPIDLPLISSYILELYYEDN